MTSYETVLLDRRDAVAVVRLNRVDKHNAISRQMSADLIAVIDELEADDDVRVLVLTGAGDKAFCAGADMAQAALEEGPADWSRDWAAQAAVRLARVRKPLIGAINGYAYGGGAVFALQCDVRICSDDVKFRFVGAVYGLVVGASRLPSLVGPAVAKELIFTARTVDAEEALRIGLANHVVPRAELEPFVVKMAMNTAQNSLPALIASKEVIDIASGFREAAKREFEHNTELRQTDEHKRRFRAAARARRPGLVRLTFHGTPAAYFDSLDPAQPYVPADFERDGFIHCTDGERRLADTLSAYYSDSSGDWLVLYIDKDRVRSRVEYEDPERVFPHIYGPLNRDEIVAVRPIGRLADVRFLPPRRFVPRT